MAHNELSGQSNVNNVPSNSSSNLPEPITRDVAVQKNTSVPATQDFQQTQQEALDNGLVPAILQQYGDETLYVENFKLDHGWRHSLQGYARSKIEEAFSPYITLHLGGGDIKKEIKEIENNPDDIMHAHQIAYNIIKEYDSGKISKETALKYSKELIAAVPDVGEGLFNYDMSGAVDENGVPLMSYHMDNRLEELGFKEKGSSLEEQTKQWERNNSISDEFATNILLTKPDEKTKEKQELRDSSAFILKFAGRNLKSAAKMGTSLAYMYGMKLINAGMGAQFQRGGFAASDEAMSGVKSIASTGWGYTRAMGGAVLSTMSMQIKAYAKLAKSAISEKWSEGLEDRYNKKRGKLLKIKDDDKRNKKLEQNDEKFRAKANKRTSSSDAHAGTDKENPFKAIAGQGLKQLGVNAAAGLAKGAIKSPKKMVSFSTRQLSKMTTEAFGQTNSTLSSMWSTSKKTLRYSKKTIKAVAKAPKRIKQSIETMRNLGKAIAKVAQAIARAVAQVVTQVTSFLMSNPIILGIIGAVVAAILLGQLLGSCTYVCSELGSGVLGALFVTPYHIGEQVWQDYITYENAWYGAFTGTAGRYGDENYSENTLEEADRDDLIIGTNTGGHNDAGISLYEDYFGVPCPYTAEQIDSAGTVVTYGSRWTNPYALICYMTTVYGDFTTEYMENGLDNVIGSINDKEHSLFFTQYNISLEFKPTGSQIKDEEGKTYNLSDYNCTTDEFVNVAEKHEEISSNSSGEDITIVQYVLSSDVFVVEDSDGNAVKSEDNNIFNGKIFDSAYKDENDETVQRSGRIKEILSNMLNNRNVISTSHVLDGQIISKQSVQWGNKSRYIEDAENNITDRWVFSGTELDDDGNRIPATIEQNDKEFFLDIYGNTYENLSDISSDKILYKTITYYIYYCYYHTYTLTEDQVYPEVTIVNNGTFEGAIECLKTLDEEDAQKNGKELEVRDGYFTVYNCDSEQEITFDTDNNSTDYTQLVDGCVVIDYQNPYEDYSRVRQFQELCYNYGYCTYSDYGQKEEADPEDYSEPKAWNDDENPTKDISDYMPENEADKELISTDNYDTRLIYIYDDGYSVDAGTVSKDGYWFPLYWGQGQANDYNGNDANDPEYALYNNNSNATDNFGNSDVGGYVTYKMFLAGYYGLYHNGEVYDPGFPFNDSMRNQSSAPGSGNGGNFGNGEGGTGTFDPDRSKGEYFDYYDFDDDLKRIYDEVSGACWPLYDRSSGEPVTSGGSYVNKMTTYSDHNARDMGGNSYDFVVAAYSGTVVGITNCYGEHYYTTVDDAYNTTYGNNVYIRYDADGYDDLAKKAVGYDGVLFGRYAHLVAVDSGISVNDHVDKGQIIGYCGHTGHTEGGTWDGYHWVYTHLHFEMNFSSDKSSSSGTGQRFDSARLFPSMVPMNMLDTGCYYVAPRWYSLAIDHNRSYFY